MHEHPETTTRDNATQGMPTWVKGFVVAAAILTILVIMLLIGDHGPGRHSQGGLSAQRAGQSTSTSLLAA